MTTQHDYRSLRAIGTEHLYRSGLTCARGSGRGGHTHRTE